MRVLDCSFDSPEQNLALDEALFRSAEAGETPETIRFWESRSHFVVLGLTQKLHEEVHESACVTQGVPIARRCSGGGCVLQGPGCLNYSLILDIDRDTELRTIRSSYARILGRLSSAFRSRDIDAVPAGISDLAIGDRKISGSAQRRGKRFILHHGTLLYRANVELIQRCLREPVARPDYRGSRSHGEFVGEVSAMPQALREVVRDAFPEFAGAAELERASPEEEARAGELVESKYGMRDWTYRR